MPPRESMVQINVGGVSVETSLTTLCRQPKSRLAKLFSSNLVTFLDRPSGPFLEMLTFLQYDRTDDLSFSPAACEEARFWEIQGMQCAEHVISHKEFLGILLMSTDESITLKKANLRQVDFSCLCGNRKVCFDDCILPKCCIAANFRDSEFRNWAPEFFGWLSPDLSYCRFIKCDFVQGSFCSIRAEMVYFEDCKIHGEIFSGGSLKGAFFRRCSFLSFPVVTFSKIDLTGAVFLECRGSPMLKGCVVDRCLAKGEPNSTQVQIRQDALEQGWTCEEYFQN